MTLNDKQQRFVDEYIIDLNATQAAIRAGYSENTAYSQGQRLLKNVEIQSEIQKAKERRSKRTEITQDKVVQELAKVGFADIKDYLSFGTALTTVGYNDDGEKIIDYAHVVQLKNSDEVDGAVISEVSLKDGALKFKLHDKMKALNDLGRHLGMFTDKVEHSGELTQHIDSDLSKLSVEELKQIESILSKAD